MMNKVSEMKLFLILVNVFISIFGVDSAIELYDTIPQEGTFPALILRRNYFLLMAPAVPNNKVIKKGIPKFKFEIFDLKISYACPKNNTRELQLSDSPQCDTELEVIALRNGDKCGNSKRIAYEIGYGIKDKLNIFPFKIKALKNIIPEIKRVQYPLYKSCVDKDNKTIVHHVKYQFKGNNKLNYRAGDVYPIEQRAKIAELDKNFTKKMAVNFNLIEDEEPEEGDEQPESSNRMLEEEQSWEAGKQPETADETPEGSEQDIEGSQLIPFQLVSHKEMILYNWKLTTFNEMNYSVIWSNIARNAWKMISSWLKSILKVSQCDLDVYSGAHEYTMYGYPQYLWKFIRSYLKGIAIIVHNHPENDHERDYPLLCEPVPCEIYGFPYNPNGKNKNFGITYCCDTKSLQKKIPFFKDRFVKMELLHTKYLCSDNPQYPPVAYLPLDSNAPNRINSLATEYYSPASNEPYAADELTSSSTSSGISEEEENPNPEITSSMERAVEGRKAAIDQWATTSGVKGRWTKQSTPSSSSLISEKEGDPNRAVYAGGVTSSMEREIEKKKKVLRKWARQTPSKSSSSNSPLEEVQYGDLSGNSAAPSMQRVAEGEHEDEESERSLYPLSSFSPIDYDHYGALNAGSSTPSMQRVDEDVESGTSPSPLTSLSSFSTIDDEHYGALTGRSTTPSMQRVDEDTVGEDPTSSVSPVSEGHYSTHFGNYAP